MAKNTKRKKELTIPEPWKENVEYVLRESEKRISALEEIVRKGDKVTELFEMIEILTKLHETLKERVIILEKESIRRKTEKVEPPKGECKCFDAEGGWKVWRVSCPTHGTEPQPKRGHSLVDLHGKCGYCGTQLRITAAGHEKDESCCQPKENWEEAEEIVDNIYNQKDALYRKPWHVQSIIDFAKKRGTYYMAWSASQEKWIDEEEVKKQTIKKVLERVDRFIDYLIDDDFLGGADTAIVGSEWNKLKDKLLNEL